jgi:translocation and assembly module TamB
MSGVGFFDKLSLNRVYISSDIHDIKMKFVEGVGATIGGKLFYESSLKGSSLTGNIDVKKAKYKKRVEWKSWLIGYKEIKESTLNYPKFLKDTGLNIRIAGSDDIIIDNNIARSPVKISLNVAGTVSQYGLIGRIEASEGTIYFRNNEFNIIEGSNVDFVSPYEIAPVFNILAETYLSDYYIRLSLGGTMDKFSLSLFSDPPLSETEILSLLTFGQIEKEAKGIESGIAAGEATALITGGIQEEVEKEFQYITGFDRFEIEPYTTSEGAFTPRITVGKRLFEDKIFVTYSDAIGTAEEQIIKVKYKLTDKLSLVGSKDEIGSTGVDIKYKFEFK